MTSEKLQQAKRMFEITFDYKQTKNIKNKDILIMVSEKYHSIFIKDYINNFSSNNNRVFFVASKFEQRNKYINTMGMQLITKEELKKENMKFDYILMNPPYLKGLHIKLFNENVQRLKNKGSITSIQPAVAYHSKLKSKGQMKQMQDFIEEYDTKVMFVSGLIFPGAVIMSDLSITTLKKIQSQKEVSEVTYKNNKKYLNVELKYISKSEIDPEIYKNIMLKYKNYITKVGSLAEKVVKNIKISEHPKNLNIHTSAKMATVRGHTQEIGINPDFYTFFSSNDPYNLDVDFGLQCEIGTKENLYKYLELIVPRFGLCFTKYNNNGTTFENVPIMDFSQVYTNEELFDELKITKKEKEAMISIIHHWNHW